MTPEQKERAIQLLDEASVFINWIKLDEGEGVDPGGEEYSLEARIGKFLNEIK